MNNMKPYVPSKVPEEYLDADGLRISADHVHSDIMNEADERKAEDSKLSKAIADEASTRKAQDDALGKRIDDERAARIAKDDELSAEDAGIRSTLAEQVADLKQEIGEVQSSIESQLSDVRQVPLPGEDGQVLSLVDQVAQWVDLETGDGAYMKLEGDVNPDTLLTTGSWYCEISQLANYMYKPYGMYNGNGKALIKTYEPTDGIKVQLLILVPEFERRDEYQYTVSQFIRSYPSVNGGVNGPPFGPWVNFGRFLPMNGPQRLWQVPDYKIVLSAGADNSAMGSVYGMPVKDCVYNADGKRDWGFVPKYTSSPLEATERFLNAEGEWTKIEASVDGYESLMPLPPLEGEDIELKELTTVGQWTVNASQLHVGNLPYGFDTSKGDFKCTIKVSNPFDDGTVLQELVRRNNRTMVKYSRLVDTKDLGNVGSWQFDTLSAGVVSGPPALYSGNQFIFGSANLNDGTGNLYQLPIEQAVFGYNGNLYAYGILPPFSGNTTYKGGSVFTGEGKWNTYSGDSVSAESSFMNAKGDWVKLTDGGTWSKVSTISSSNLNHTVKFTPGHFIKRSLGDMYLYNFSYQMDFQGTQVFGKLIHFIGSVKFPVAGAQSAQLYTYGVASAGNRPFSRIYQNTLPVMSEGLNSFIVAVLQSEVGTNQNGISVDISLLSDKDLGDSTENWVVTSQVSWCSYVGSSD